MRTYLYKASRANMLSRSISKAEHASKGTPKDLMGNQYLCRRHNNYKQYEYNLISKGKKTDAYSMEDLLMPDILNCTQYKIY